MIRDFWNDLNNAKYAEKLVRETFSQLTDKYTFEDVADIKEYRYRGDIRATAADGRQIYIEVKDDGRIADTGNVLCEEENFYKDGGYFGKGNMQSNYDIYCVVSQSERNIYVIDFPTLQANYKKGQFKIIHHYDQDTYCYLLPIGTVKRLGGLIAEVSY